MLQDINLRELAEVRGNGQDVLSAYFRGSEGLSQLSHREETIRDLLEDDPLELENFEASLVNIRTMLGDNPVDTAVGVCCFSSEILGFLRGYPIAMEVPNRLIVGPAPYIRPLAELQDEYETFLIVRCDNDRTQLFTVTNKTSENETAIKGGIKNHVRKGGWSQQRYERRRDEHLGHYGSEVAEQVDKLVREHSINRIVLIGSSETMQAIDEQLHGELQNKVVGREAFDLGRSDDEMIERAYESYFADERQQEQDLWRRIKNETLSEGRGCLGAEDTLDAAKLGRVEVALATRDAQLRATKCKECENIASGKRDSCPACKSQDVFSVDYIDALARQLELTSARLDFVDSIPALVKRGHVGALLRY